MECLLTKLKGTVNDNSLLMLGELPIKIYNSSNTVTKLSITTSDNDCVYRLLGNTYFTDKSGTQNYGQTINYSSLNEGYMYISPGDCTVIISNKYSINKVLLSRNSSFKFGLDLNNLYSLPLSELDISGEYIIGDIRRYLKSNTKLVLNECHNIDELNYSDLEKLTESSWIYIRDANISGDITNLIQGTTYKGVLNEVNSLCYKVKHVTGDISKARSTIFFISFSGTPSELTWSTERDNTSTVIAIEGKPNFGNDLDAMLINQAKCIKSSSTTSSWHLTISATGVRTSASDEAIATLQSKGFTVSVPTITVPANASMMLMAAPLNSDIFGIAYEGKNLIIEPVNLSTTDIYPAKDVIVKEFNSQEEAEQFITAEGLVRRNSLSVE